VTATVDIGRRKRRATKLRGEEGIGLVELLIALLVLNIGIFATLAAFTSGALALRRASHTSTASAIADKYMECFRDASYTNITWPMTTGNCTSASPVGADGLTYHVAATVSTGSQLSSGTYTGSTAVKLVNLTVTGPGAKTTVLATSSSTFSLCTQSALGTETNPCKS
jgi:Tfp pilus assembly protein PilV